MKMPAFLYEKSVRVKEVTMNVCLLVTVFLLLKLRAYRTKKNISISDVLYPFMLYLSSPHLGLPVLQQKEWYLQPSKKL